MYYGLEFDGQVLDKWSYRTGVRLSFIRPGRPNENAYIESFNASSATNVSTNTGS
jgi:putative transposase